MFNKLTVDKPNVLGNNNNSTIIADGVLIKGSIKSSGSVIMNGRFEGDINIDQSLTIGKKGVVVGEVKAKNLIVNGLLDGDITADDIHILEIGKIYGKVTYKSLEIEKNGIFEGEGKNKSSNYHNRYDTKTKKISQEKEPVAQNNQQKDKNNNKVFDIEIKK
ncbi:MAG: hypothetical protein B1H07_00210 [Campylobacteraceae bacterium 4484_166]|nr:MAG: hypothetical protein B1H07_00210 [Campylobacteraceae bacterium 4484_166]